MYHTYMTDARTELEQIDQALMRLRRFFDPPAMVDDEGRRVEASTILVLETLAGPGPRTVRDIAEELDVAHSTASRLVKRAEQAGMVRRRPSPTNRRETVVEATEQGDAARQRGVRYRIERLTAITVTWQPDEIERFATSLHHFAEAATDSRSSWPVQMPAKSPSSG